MRRREFVTLLGGAAAWPLAASAQQPAMQVVGMLNPQSLRASGHLIDAFRRVFTETGYVEGQNVAIEYHFSEGRVDRLAEMAADLIRRQVSVIAAPGTVPARVATAATHTIPIVFGVSEDPVKLGLVASLAHPGGNATGINSFSSEVNGKRLGLLRELLPRAARVAVLVNPANTTNTSSVLADVEPAARALGLQLQIYNASTSGEIDAAFAALVRERPDALFLASDGLFSTRRVQLISLAARHALPASYASRESVEAAETSLQQGIAVSRTQGARGWELRASTSLARLWCDQGTRAEARDLLAPIYGRFTEGFGTPDLKEAKALLDALAS